MRLDGTVQLERILPVSPRFVVKPGSGPLEVVKTYTVLGIEHILTGFDHLLYVLGMLILVGGWRRIVVTMSALACSSETPGLRRATTPCQRAPRES